MIFYVPIADFFFFCIWRVLDPAFQLVLFVFCSFFFLAIFRNEIKTILTLWTSEEGGGMITFFILEVPDYKSTMLIYFTIQWMPFFRHGRVLLSQLTGYLNKTVTKIAPYIKKKKSLFSSCTIYVQYSMYYT